MMPQDLDQRINKAVQLGVPRDVVMARVKKKYPKYGEKSVQGFVGNVGKNALDIAQGVTQLPGAFLNQMQEQGSPDPWYAAANLGAKAVPGIVDEVKQFASNPVDYTYKNPLDVALAAFPAEKVVSKVAKVPKYVSKSKVGKMIEENAANAGRSKMSDVLESVGNPERYEKIGAATDLKTVRKVVQDEINALVSNYGNVSANKGPLYHDLLGRRAGAGKKAVYDKGTRPTIEQQTYKQIQRAYSDLLKVGAETGTLDKIYSVLEKLEGTSGKILSGAKYAGGGALLYLLLDKLKGK